MTVFLRILEAPIDDKPEALLRALTRLHDAGKQDSRFQRAIFEREPEVFSAVPGSPFAYWVSESVRQVFRRMAAFTSRGRVAVSGGKTLDDFRWIRVSWEVDKTRGNTWVGFAKGGAFSPYYSDVHLLLDWRQDARALKSYLVEYRSSRGWSPNWTAELHGSEHYFRPGLTWPRRTNGLSFRPMPADCIFADKGPAALVDGDSTDYLLAICSLLNSRVFGYLVSVQLARTELAQSYEVGLIQQTPVPDLSDDGIPVLAGLARRAWSLKRALDTTNETSHAFLLPPGVNEKITGFDRQAAEREIESIQIEIDEIVFQLYDIGPEDRNIIEASAKRGSTTTSVGDAAADAESEEGSDSEEEAIQNETHDAAADTLFSWLVGVAFGRFDLRLATGKRAVPPEPEPFDPLPSRSPGMWPEDEPRVELPPDIMVDDAGHSDDIREHVANAATKTGWPDPNDLRQWLAREFFPLHIKIYSKSRRKAPIYWQLATHSASYSVWLYIHAFTKDTLFRVQNDYVAPKLAHEERRLEAMTRELREKASPAQRKELAAQEGFVDELRAFLEEVKRVAPLWNPNLDDGVIINFAPLWRLVPHHKPWQKELKATWDALVDEKYDWSHLAMYLWPERVVPKCATDRSFAIAHGLEDVFWIKGDDNKWTARATPTRVIDELVRERTSTAVRAALQSLLDAPVATGNPARGRGKVAKANKGKR